MGTPDEPPVHYWASDEFDFDYAYFVSYSAFVSNQPNDWSNPRHRCRCLKEL